LRFLAEDGDDRLLVVNLGGDLSLLPMPEPLLAPPRAKSWETLWSSEDRRYGGAGAAPLDTSGAWRLPAESATLLHPVPAQPAPDHLA
jgi:maltooligosyltrehalose trehalohydrolase